MNVKRLIRVVFAFFRRIKFYFLHIKGKFDVESNGVLKFLFSDYYDENELETNA